MKIKLFQKKTGLQLPSSVFQTDVETDVGLLNKAVPITGKHRHKQWNILWMEMSNEILNCKF